MVASKKELGGLVRDTRAIQVKYRDSESLRMRCDEIDGLKDVADDYDGKAYIVFTNGEGQFRQYEVRRKSRSGDDVWQVLDKKKGKKLDMSEAR